VNKVKFIIFLFFSFLHIFVYEFISMIKFVPMYKKKYFWKFNLNLLHHLITGILMDREEGKLVI
jgi:hypothetical protein